VDKMARRLRLSPLLLALAATALLGAGQARAQYGMAPAGPDFPTTGTETAISPIPDGSLEVIEPGTTFGPLPADAMIGPEQAICDDWPSVYSSGSWFKAGRWYSQAEFAMLHKAQPRELPLAVDLFNGEVFSNIETSHRYEAGMRVTIGRMLGRDDGHRDHMLEFSYAGLFDWDTSAQITAGAQGDAIFGIPGSLNTILGVLQFDGTAPISGFDNADQQNWIYSSELDDWQLNVRIAQRPERDRAVLMPDGRWVQYDAASTLWAFEVGARVTTLEEAFLYTSQGTVPLANSGRYEVITHNDMVGLHLGFERLEKFTAWHWGISSNIGGLVNFADRSSRIDTVNGIASQAEDINDENMVFLAHASIFAAYQVRTNLAFRGSYEFMYLQGVALAAENVGFPGQFARFNLEGDALLHGLFLGLDGQW